jgi:hypothetical protein
MGTKVFLAIGYSLARSGFHYKPLLLDSGNQVGNKYNFSFELALLKNEGLFEMVAQNGIVFQMGPVPWKRGRIRSVILEKVKMYISRYYKTFFARLIK